MRAQETADVLSEDRPLRRREALIAIGGAGLGSFWLARALTGRSGSTVAQADCILSKEATEGPYWVANHLTRRNITEGRTGMPLRLRLKVLDAATCKPIKCANVELWHADAGGVYSAGQGNTNTRPATKRPLWLVEIPSGRPCSNTSYRSSLMTSGSLLLQC